MLYFIHHHNSYLFSSISQMYVAANKNKINKPDLRLNKHLPTCFFTFRRLQTSLRFANKNNASVNSTCARPLPPAPHGLLRGICPSCQSRGWGICKFCAARGPGICQPQGHSQAFDTHAVSYQN